MTKKKTHVSLNLIAVDLWLHFSKNKYDIYLKKVCRQKLVDTMVKELIHIKINVVIISRPSNLFLNQGCYLFFLWKKGRFFDNFRFYVALLILLYDIIFFKNQSMFPSCTLNRCNSYCVLLIWNSHPRLLNIALKMTSFCCFSVFWSTYILTTNCLQFSLQQTMY